jgi:hypothetical protein
MHLGGDLVEMANMEGRRVREWNPEEEGEGALTFGNYDCGRKFQCHWSFPRRTCPYDRQSCCYVLLKLCFVEVKFC